MRVKQVLLPLWTVNLVRLLRVQPHYCRQNLGDEENCQPGAEAWKTLVLALVRDRGPLSLRVRPGGHHYAKGEEDDGDDLDARVFLPPQRPCEHGRDAPSRPEDDM